MHCFYYRGPVIEASYRGSETVATIRNNARYDVMDDIIDFLCRIFLFLYNNCLLVLLVSEVIGKLYKMNRLINAIIKEGY